MRHKKLSGNGHLSEAACRVKARCKQKTDRRGGYLFFRRARLAQERRKAGSCRISKSFKSAADDIPVLARERNDVGNRTYSRKIGIALDYLLAFALNGTHELQSNADSRKILIRIHAVVLLGVNNGYRFGYSLLAALVMIGYDEVDAHLFGVLGLLGCGYAAVNAYYEADALAVQRVDRRAVESVALADAVGYIRIALKPPAAQPIGQKAGRGYAVNVVVTVNGYRLAHAQSASYPCRGPVHVLHQKRIA